MRLGLIPYFGLVSLLLAGQYYAATTLTGANAVMGALFVLQLLKVPLAAARARDLGWDADEAVMALLPIGNLALFWRLLARTPSDEDRARRARVHVGESTALDLVMGAVRALPKVGHVALPAAVGVGLADAVLTESAIAYGEQVALWEGARLTLMGQIAMVVTGLLFLYTLMQTTKSATAKRATWFPSLFLPTSIGLSISLVALGAAKNGADPGQMTTIGMIFLGFSMLPFYAIAGAWAAAVVHLCARGIERDEPVGFDLWGMAATRLTELAAPHAGVRYLITIGLQVMVVPGLMYATQYALVDQVAWEEPEARALRRSGDLTRGHRSRVFRMLLLVGVVFGIFSIGVSIWDLGDVYELNLLLFNPFALSSTAVVINGAVMGIGFAIFELAATKMYFERLAILEPATEAASQTVTAPDDSDPFAPPSP